jgi:hypothetical protein
MWSDYNLQDKAIFWPRLTQEQVRKPIDPGMWIDFMRTSSNIKFLSAGTMH